MYAPVPPGATFHPARAVAARTGFAGRLPRAEDRELPYELSPEYRALFESVLAYARETVQGEEKGSRRERIRWWPAIAVLRSLASSPAAVTGNLPPEDREERVDALAARAAEGKKVLLVATDCLSEGINLQHAFNAVFHYDLSWNPTRHEQREGRVDRYLQKSPEVRVVTSFGRDNRIDGIVLDVLLRKHKRIRSDLGISVSVPGEAQDVMKAVFEGLFLRGRADTGVLGVFEEFEDFFNPTKQKLHGEWQAAADREKRSRTLFPQEMIKSADVEAEMKAAQAAVGSGADAAPTGNLDPGLARDAVHEIVADLPALEPAFTAAANERAAALHAAHERVREAARSCARTREVVPQPPVDVLGVYVYLPEARA